MSTTGSPRNLGGLAVSTDKIGGPETVTKFSRPPVPVPGAEWERTRGTRDGTASRGPKRGGKGGKESERLILPVKLGNLPQGTQWREGDAELRNCWRERCLGHRAQEEASQRNCSG